MDDRVELLNVLSLLGAKIHARTVKKIGSGEVSVESEESSSTDLGYVSFTGDVADTDVLLVRSRRKNGPEEDSYYGSDTIIFPINKYNNPAATEENHCTYYTLRTDSSLKLNGTYAVWGVYASQFSYTDKQVKIQTRYSATYSKNIISDYTIEIYKISWPAL